MLDSIGGFEDQRAARSGRTRVLAESRNSQIPSEWSTLSAFSPDPSIGFDHRVIGRLQPDSIRQEPAIPRVEFGGGWLVLRKATRRDTWRIRAELGRTDSYFREGDAIRSDLRGLKLTGWAIAVTGSY